MIKIKDNFYDKANEGYCIVMELCDGDLRKILNKYKPKGLPLNIINKIFYQLNDVLIKMIKINYLHRDLKPENILIKYTDNNKNNFDIRLTDFGLSTKNIHSSVHTFSLAGSKNYMAPEVENYQYNNKCDLWSLGVILYELYTNKYIFDSEQPKEREINRYEGKIKNEIDNLMINKLIRKLIQVDIDKRLNWEKYFNDDFFEINIPLILCLFDSNNEEQKAYCLKVITLINHKQAIKFEIKSIPGSPFSIKINYFGKLIVIQNQYDNSEKMMEDTLLKIYKILNE